MTPRKDKRKSTADVTNSIEMSKTARKKESDLEEDMMAAAATMIPSNVRKSVTTVTCICLFLRGTMSGE
jgi:hypothetical protein